MIALPHHMPFVRIGEDNLISYQPEWLEQKVIDASADTDVPEFLSTCVVDGINRYLSNSYEGTVIGSDELHEKIVTLLDSMGLNDVSKNLDRTPPPITINLARLAAKAVKTGGDCFYALLEDTCHDALRSGSTNVVVSGMSECLRILSQSQSAPVSHHALKTEIEHRIDEVRKIGELCLPVFNVIVA